MRPSPAERENPVLVPALSGVGDSRMIEGIVI